MIPYLTLLCEVSGNIFYSLRKNLLRLTFVFLSSAAPTASESYNEQRSTFEILPDELILIACTFLSAIDILYAFDNLNNRLDAIIAEHRSHLNLSKTTWKQFQHFFSTTEIYQKIQSVVIDNHYNTSLSAVVRSFLPNLTNLKRVKLLNISGPELCLFTEQLKTVITLEEFAIDCDDYIHLLTDDEACSVVTNLLSIKSLKTFYELLCRDHFKLNEIIAKQQQLQPALNLKKCHILLQNTDDLFSLSQLTPQLEYLSVKIHLVLPFTTSQLQHLSSLTHLREFRFSWCETWPVTFCLVEQLLTHVPKSVETFLLNIGTRDTAFLNGQQLENILKVHLPQVKVFEYVVNYSDNRLSSAVRIDQSKVLQSFSSDFYLKEKKWFIECYPFDKDYFHLHTIPSIRGTMHTSQTPKSFGNVMSTTNQKLISHKLVKTLTITKDIQSTEEALYFLQHCPNIRCLIFKESLKGKQKIEKKDRDT